MECRRTTGSERGRAVRRAVSSRESVRLCVDTGTRARFDKGGGLGRSFRRRGLSVLGSAPLEQEALPLRHPRAVGFAIHQLGVHLRAQDVQLCDGAIFLRDSRPFGSLGQFAKPFAQCLYRRNVQGLRSFGGPFCAFVETFAERHGILRFHGKTECGSPLVGAPGSSRGGVSECAVSCKFPCGDGFGRSPTLGPVV